MRQVCTYTLGINKKVNAKCAYVYIYTHEKIMQIFLCYVFVVMQYLVDKMDNNLRLFL